MPIFTASACAATPPPATVVSTSNVAVSSATTSVRWQITQIGWATAQGAPKSDAGERPVALDTQTIAVLTAHRQRHDIEREQAGAAWTQTGFEFTNPDGSPLHPAAVTYTFEMLAYLAGLPPIRLHDLRHGAATLALVATAAS